MADYTNNLNLILPGDDDYTLVENLTDDYQAIDDFAGDVVKVYDPTTTHSKREYCIYQDHLYKCNSFITQPEAFDPSKWDRVILGDEVRNNNSYITNMQSGLAIVQDGDTATKAITQGQYVLWKSSMRYAKANIAIGETLGSTNLGSVTYDNGALNRLNEQIGKSVPVDITSQCTFASCVNSSGPYTSKIYYNETEKIVFGTIYCQATLSNVTTIVELPSALKVYATGCCGNAVHDSPTPFGILLHGSAGTNVLVAYFTSNLTPPSAAVFQFMVRVS